MTTFEGHFVAGDARFGIVVARFNALITEKLLEGALDTLKRHGVDTDTVDVAWAPGAFELPLVVQKLARSDRYDCVIALGCVIRGGTPHFDYVAGEAAKGLGVVQLQTGVPVAFGVLTTNSIEQALERAGTKMGNKGGEAAMAALEMVSLMSQLEG